MRGRPAFHSQCDMEEQHNGEMTGHWKEKNEEDFLMVFRLLTPRPENFFQDDPQNQINNTLHSLKNYVVPSPSPLCLLHNPEYYNKFSHIIPLGSPFLLFPFHRRLLISFFQSGRRKKKKRRRFITVLFSTCYWLAIFALQALKSPMFWRTLAVNIFVI